MDQKHLWTTQTGEKLEQIVQSGAQSLKLVHLNSETGEIIVQTDKDVEGTPATTAVELILPDQLGTGGWQGMQVNNLDSLAEAMQFLEEEDLKPGETNGKLPSLHFTTATYTVDINNTARIVTETLHPSKASGSCNSPTAISICLPDEDSTPSSKMKKGLKIRKIQCYFCDKIITGQANFERHMKTHMVENKTLYPCKFCKVVFSDLRIAIDHGNKHKAEVTCAKCKESFVDEAEKKSHETTCDSYRYLQEDVEETPLSVQENLTKLQQNKPVRNIRKVHCYYCDKIITGQANFDRHVKTHMVGNKTLYPCKICAENFTSLELVTQHLVEYDHTKFSYCCKCKRAFGTKEEVTAHEVSCRDTPIEIPSLNGTVADTSDPSLSIDSNSLVATLHCNEDGTNPVSLENHSDIESSYMCPYCKRTFSNIELVLRHSEVCAEIPENNPTLVFSCSTCKDRFRTEGDLQEHELLCTVLCKLKEENAENIDEMNVYDQIRLFSKMRSHTDENGSQNLIVFCLTCSTDFHYDTYFNEHFEQCYESNHFVCPFCSEEKLKIPETISEHYKQHIFQVTDMTDCVVCKASFLTVSNAVFHSNKVHINSSLSTEYVT